MLYFAEISASFLRTSSAAFFLAAQIIAVEDADLAKALTDARKKAAEDVLKKDAEIAAKYSK